MNEQEELEARPHEVQFWLTWALDQDGTLVGDLRVRNISQRTVRVSGKPSLRPLGVDGQPLDTRFIVTLEGRLPNYVQLASGAEAVAPVGSGGWTGPPASGCVVVGWPGGRVEVSASGPRQPTSPGPATNLWSSWFTEQPARGISGRLR